MSVHDRRERFRDLHQREGIFLMPNAFDAGSTRLLTSIGFEALATTSAGFAWSLGRGDQQITRDELVEHVRALAAATELPLSVDSERGFGETPDEVAETVRRLAAAGAAGCSIEDYDPMADAIDPVERASERVAAAAAAAHHDGLVLTARAENLLHGVDDLADTIARLRAYRAAGADVVYAPGLESMAEISAVVTQVDAPVNVLMLPGVPRVDELQQLGVRRVSTGSLLTSVAYGGMLRAARELLDLGTPGYARGGLTADDKAAFGRDSP
jgi:2-methylisocitrate lyase-like PEP mutase family enzyme